MLVQLGPTQRDANFEDQIIHLCDYSETWLYCLHFQQTCASIEVSYLTDLSFMHLQQKFGTHNCYIYYSILIQNDGIMELSTFIK